MAQFCEPNFYAAQHIDMEALREEFASSAKVAEEKKKKAEHIKKPWTPELIDSKILPVFDKYSDHIKKMLSLKRNEYMRLKYNRFLDNPTEKVIIVRPFAVPTGTGTVPKPMILTGRFYDINNKLAPIPHIPDPRKYERKTLSATKSKI